MREWDVGKGEKDKEKEKLRRDERPLEKRRHHTPERSPEPGLCFIITRIAEPWNF